MDRDAPARHGRARRCASAPWTCSLRFETGDEIRTEISRKFRRAAFERDLHLAGLDLRGWYSDDDARFALALAAPAGG